jgi:hypothetical protein
MNIKINNKVKFKLYTNTLEGIVKKIIDPNIDDIYDFELYQILITKKLDNNKNLINIDNFKNNKHLINVNKSEILEIIEDIK